MIEDMNIRGFSAKTQHDYLRIVERFAAFLGCSPDLASPEDIRRFQVEQREAEMPAPTMNSHISPRMSRKVRESGTASFFIGQLRYRFNSLRSDRRHRDKGRHVG